MSSPVFVSYSSTDQKMAESICVALESRGYPCWISCRDIGPGENFQESIVKAIRSAKIMVLVFTSNANNSDEIKKEIVLAGRYRVTVVPVRVEDVVPNDALAYEFATRQWIDLFKDWEREIERLTSQIKSILTAQSPNETTDIPSSIQRSTQVPTTERSSLRLIAVAIGMVIIGLGIGGGYWYTRSTGSTNASLPPAPAQPLNDEIAWSDALKSGSVRAFRQYLIHFGDGAHAVEARQRIRAAEDDFWKTTDAARTIEAFNQYLEIFPRGRHSAQARSNIDNLNRKSSDERAWLDASNVGTISSFNNYLKAFPSGAHTLQAQQRISELGTASTNEVAKVPAATPFDGVWVTTISCPAAAGALGFSYQLDAQVKNGVYHGDHGMPGRPGWLTLDGNFLSNGAVDLYAKGIVNSSAIAAGNVPVGTEYGYHVTGQFTGTNGTGNRVEGRPCAFTFVKK